MIFTKFNFCLSKIGLISKENSLLSNSLTLKYNLFFDFRYVKKSIFSCFFNKLQLELIYYLNFNFSDYGYFNNLFCLSLFNFFI